MGPGAEGAGEAVWGALRVAAVRPGVWVGGTGFQLLVLWCDGVDGVAGRVVWLLGCVALPVVWLAVGGLVPVVQAGGVRAVGSEAGAVWGPPAAACALFSVVTLVSRARIPGLADGVLFVVAREVVARGFIVVCVVGVSEVEAVAAV